MTLRYFDDETPIKEQVQYFFIIYQKIASLMNSLKDNYPSFRKYFDLEGIFMAFSSKN